MIAFFAKVLRQVGDGAGCARLRDNTLIVPVRLTGDRGMPLHYVVRLEALSDIDGYRAYAAGLHSVPYEDVTDEQRRKAKIALYQAAYGLAKGVRR